MANDKDKLNGGMDLGELGMIRNILMGEQVNEFQAKFTEIEGQLSETTSSLELRLKELEKTAFNAQASMQKELSTRMDKMENNVQKRLEQLEEKLVATSQKDRQKVGKLLADIGKKLMDS